MASPFHIPKPPKPPTEADIIKKYNIPQSTVENVRTFDAQALIDRGRDDFVQGVDW